MIIIFLLQVLFGINFKKIIMIIKNSFRRNNDGPEYKMTLKGLISYSAINADLLYITASDRMYHKKWIPFMNL